MLFDYDGDGIRTGTGWVKADDALLAWDRNGNGQIDNGSELFGVDTVLANGKKASDGFAALRDLDSNSDGVFSAADAHFAEVRVWRDLNQDGVSQDGELKSLAETGITAINLQTPTVNRSLAGGNVQSAVGTFSGSNGSSGSAGNLNLASNGFYREFTDHIALTARALPLPDMQGSGKVRDLREAVSQSDALAAFSAASPLASQMARLAA